MATDLRLGVALCRPHICQFCGAQVDQLRRQGLSCRRSQEYQFRHVTMNDITVEYEQGGVPAPSQYYSWGNNPPPIS